MSDNETMSDDLKRENALADSLIQKLQRINGLWGEVPSEDDLEELAKHADGLAGRLEAARETYMDGDFPAVESLQELAKEAAVLADNVSQSDGNGETNEDGAPNTPTALGPTDPAKEDCVRMSEKELKRRLRKATSDERLAIKTLLFLHENGIRFPEMYQEMGIGYLLRKAPDEIVEFLDDLEEDVYDAICEAEGTFMEFMVATLEEMIHDDEANQ